MSAYRLLIAGAFVVALAVAGGTALLLLRSDESQDKPARSIAVAGETAPSFNLEAADGKFVSLEQYKGKKNVLLYFSMGYG